MRSALASVDGVEEEDVEVDYAAKTATVTCRQGCSTDALISAFEGTKFEAKIEE